MLSKKLTKLLSVLLLSLTLFIGFKYTTNKLSNTIYNNKPTHPIAITQTKDIAPTVKARVLHGETVISQLKVTDIRQIMQTSITHSITNSQGTKSGLFQNDEIVTFTGVGNYCIDKDKIKTENIFVNNENKTVTLFTNKPYVNVELIEEKTKFEYIQGKLVFWDIKEQAITHEQNRYDAKFIIKEKLSSDTYYKQANIRAKEVLTEIVQNILSELDFNDYKVIINIMD